MASHVEGLEQRELLGVLQIASAKRNRIFLRFAGANSARRPCEMRAGRAHGAVDVLLVTGGNPRQELASGGI